MGKITKDKVGMFLTIYLLVVPFVIIKELHTIATKLGVSDTIVVDASSYLQQELKESNELITTLDTEYSKLFKELQDSNKKISRLKENITYRNTSLSRLKSKLNHHDKTKIDTVVSTFSDRQHDSTFSKFFEGVILDTVPPELDR